MPAYFYLLNASPKSRKNPEVVVDGFPRRKLMRQQAPSTATFDHVEDGVKDLA